MTQQVFALSHYPETKINTRVELNGDGIKLTFSLQSETIKMEDLKIRVEKQFVCNYFEKFNPRPENNDSEINRRESLHTITRDGGDVQWLDVKVEKGDKVSGEEELSEESSEEASERHPLDESSPVAVAKILTYKIYFTASSLSGPDIKRASFLVLPLTISYKTKKEFPEEGEKVKDSIVIIMRMIKEKKKKKLSRPTLSAMIMYPPQEGSELFMGYLQNFKKRKHSSLSESPKKKKSDPLSLVIPELLSKRSKEVLKAKPHLISVFGEHEKIIRDEMADYEKLVSYYEEYSSSGTRGSTHTLCRDYTHKMSGIIKSMGGPLVVTLFAKPGYGKSYIINRILTGFEHSDIPLPSGESLEGRGLTGSVIDIVYGEHYSLEKQMCSENEYNCRVKCLPKNRERPPFSGNASGTILMDEEERMTEELSIGGASQKNPTQMMQLIAQRANSAIINYEKNKSQSDCVNVKKLILRIPSKFLSDNMLTLRDMPGYDEVSDGDFYRQYIRESMKDSCLVLCGLENSRNILDDGFVRKLYEYGLHQPNQEIQPYVAFITNDPRTSVEGYQSIMENGNLEAVMRASFSRQLSLFFDVSLDGVEIGENEVSNAQAPDFQNKSEIVAALQNNFRVVHTPPHGQDPATFLAQLETIIEENRRKLIDHSVQMMRDIAVVTLSTISTKTPRSLNVNVNFVKQFGNFSNDFISRLKKCLERIQTVSPDIDHIPSEGVSLFSSCLADFYRVPICEMCESEEVTAAIDAQAKSYRRKLRREDRIDEWRGLYPIFLDNLRSKVEAFSLRIAAITNQFERDVSDECSNRFDGEIEREFLEDFVQLADPSLSHETSDQLALFLYNRMTKCEESIGECIDELHENLKQVSLGTNKAIKTLIEKYKGKTHQRESFRVTHQEPQPKRLEGQFSIPYHESADTVELTSRSYCSRFDGVCKNNIKKRARIEIDMRRMDSHEGSTNQILISFNRVEKVLEVSYDEKFISTRVEPIQKLGTPGVRPLFVMTRPRGSGWKPLLHLKKMAAVMKSGEPSFFAIVTESRYLPRYIKWVEKEAEVSNAGWSEKDFVFVVLDSNQPLGPGIVQSCILRLAKYLHLECIHLMHDDITQFQEYTYIQKTHLPHENAMVLALKFMEKVLSYELFNPHRKEEKKARLFRSLSGLIPEEIKPQLEEMFSHDEETLEYIRGEEHSLLELVKFQIQGITCSMKLKSRYGDRISELTNELSRDESFDKLVSNPQEFVEFLRELDTNHCITCAQIILNIIEREFDDKKHIGKASLWWYSKPPAFKSKVHGIDKPTHNVAYQKSSLSTYYMPSMEAIYPVGLDSFWEEPDNELRKKTLKSIASKASDSDECTELALSRGWTGVNLSEKTQMLLHAVGGFQVFNFAYMASNGAPSLTNYKSRQGVKKIADDFDSDQEEKQDESPMEVSSDEDNQ